MKIEKVTFKNFPDTPTDGQPLHDGDLVPTHQGKESVAQHRRLDIKEQIAAELNERVGR